ncbi:MAG: aminotransferase class V-fold PLP-dependent enzyme [Balneolaceae bacterium]|nr:aminotransferase class V-fold PLP-dependent enzyme [Balneolaceae bacterium]
MISRRKLLKILSSLPLGGFLWGTLGEAGYSFDKIKTGYRDFYKELGLRTFINAKGTYTALTGSLMRKETKEAIIQSSHQYVNLNELQDAVGRRLAEMGRSESAMVTAGAASALTLGTAAVITGTDEEKIRRLPNLPGPRREVIIQKSHRFSYDHAVRNTGVKLVEVESRRELEQAINERTVMMMFLNYDNYEGQIQDEEFVAFGKKFGIPTFNDCAADLPPVENLWKYNEMGFDLVTFSGGKGLRGPQSAGLLFGRSDLIEAAKLNAPPHGDTIGRGMKVNKEEIIGMMVALEEFLEIDHDRHMKELEDRVRHIQEYADRVPGVRTEVYVPKIANHTPTLKVEWDQSKLNITPQEVQQSLRDGHPSIEVRATDESIQITMWMARPGQERVVARRLQEVMENAA